MLISKPDGSIRITVDYRKLNPVTIKDAYPLNNIYDMYTRLTKAKYFTKLDLYSGFYHILMEEESRKYTAFVVEWGLYEYQVMPMGLTNAPASFQRLMNKVLDEFIKQGIVLVFS